MEKAIVERYKTTKCVLHVEAYFLTVVAELCAIFLMRAVVHLLLDDS